MQLESGPLSPSAALSQIPRSALTPIRKLGEGEFGEVHICRLAGSSQPVAFKLLRETATESAK